MKKFLIAFFIVCLFGISYAQVLKIVGSAVQLSSVPPPPACNAFNISGPVSSLDVGRFNSSTCCPLLSEPGFRVVSEVGTFGLAFKQQDTVGGGRTLHVKVGLVSPLSLVVDQSLVSWPPNAEEDTYVFGGTANGYVVHTRPSAFFSPLSRRTIALSAENGSVLSTINFTVSSSYQLYQPQNLNGQTFDGGYFYSAGSTGPNSIFVAWNHGFSFISSNIPSAVPGVGNGYDGVSKIYTTIGSYLGARWTKFNGTDIVKDFESSLGGIYSGSNIIGSISFGNGKVYISASPSNSGSIKISRHDSNLNLEQFADISVGDGALYTGAKSIYDRLNNKFYVISNSTLGRRIFRVNPTNLSVEQTFTVSGSGLSFVFTDSAIQISHNGRRLWTLESSSFTDQYTVREYSLCS